MEEIEKYLQFKGWVQPLIKHLTASIWGLGKYTIIIEAIYGKVFIFDKYANMIVRHRLTSIKSIKKSIDKYTRKETKDATRV